LSLYRFSINVAKVGFDIVILQEPVTFKNRLIQIPPSFEGFPSRTLDTRPRAAIYARKKLKLIELDSLQTADCAVVLAKINGRQTVIASCYLDYNLQDVIPKEILNVCQYATSNNFPKSLFSPITSMLKIRGTSQRFNHLGTAPVSM